MVFVNKGMGVLAHLRPSDSEGFGGKGDLGDLGDWGSSLYSSPKAFTKPPKGMAFTL